jgi:hypothetical protein
LSLAEFRASEPDRVAQFIESGEEPMTPHLNPYLEKLDHSQRVVLISAAHSGVSSGSIIA